MKGTPGAREPLEALGELLADGTAALAHLDAESLELLQVRAVQLQMEFGTEFGAGGAAEAARAEVASRYRVFAEVLRSTQSHLGLLQRMYGFAKVSAWDR